MSTIQCAPYLMLFSGFLHAIVNAILKSGKDKMSSRALIDGFSGLLVLPFIFIVDLPTNAWGWILGSWIVHLVYIFSVIKSFEHLDMSVAYPIARGLAPVLASAGAVLIFHEHITLAILIGIFLVSSGVAIIGLYRHLPRKALGWPILTGVSIALYTVIDAQGVRAAPTAAGYIVWTFLVLGLGIGGFFALWRGRAFMAAAAQQWKPGLIAGTLSILTYGSALVALRWGSTPKLAALRETSILFGSILAVVFLKETMPKRRMMGIAVLTTGTIWLLIQR